MDPESFVRGGPTLTTSFFCFKLMIGSKYHYKQVTIFYRRYLIELLPLCNSAKCKMKFTGQWLRYSTTPNVPALSTQSLQAINLAPIFFLETPLNFCDFSGGIQTPVPPLDPCMSNVHNVGFLDTLLFIQFLTGTNR